MGSFSSRRGVRTAENAENDARTRTPIIYVVRGVPGQDTSGARDRDRQPMRLAFGNGNTGRQEESEAQTEGAASADGADVFGWGGRMLAGGMGYVR